MKKLIAIALITFSCIGRATECEPVLQKFVETIDRTGNLATGKHIYLKLFSAKEFSSSCEVTYNNTDYILYLHPDEVSVVVSFSEKELGYRIFRGPFLLAYKKQLGTRKSLHF